MIGNMFKMPRHQKFRFTPRHYDPIKEELDNRVNTNEIRSYDDRDELRMRISHGMKQRQGYSKIKAKGTMRSNILIAIITVILAMMAFLLLENL